MPPNDVEENGHTAADEVTPLLANSSAGPTAGSQGNEDALVRKPSNATTATEDDETPLPKLQIFFLCFARLVDPVSFFCIFPFVNEMIYETGNVNEADVGFYSGLIESLFSITQMLVMVFWGRAADALGRKPVLVFTLIGLSLTVSLFGFAKSIWQMILFRCLAGTFSGSIVCIRSMITELSTPRTQARAFSYFAFAGNLGIFLGPVIGGGLSKLADHYPDTIFGKSAFLKAYPYALPTMVSGSFALLAALITTLFVRETLEKEALKKPGKHAPMTTWELIRSPGVAFVLYIYGWVALLGFSYTALIPVFWFTSPKLGGFGFDERLIAVFLGIGGASQAVWLLFVFPPLQHRIGTGGVLRACSWVYPFFFLMNPLANWCLREGWRTLFWAVGPAVLVIGSGVSMNFTAVQLALNDISPSSATLGTLNAIALALSAGIRAWTPALFTTLFAIGVRNHILYGQLIWVIMIVIVLTLAISLRWLPKKAEGKFNQKKHDAEQANGQVNGQANGEAGGQNDEAPDGEHYEEGES